MGMTPKKKLNVTFLLFYVSINQINYKNLINKKKKSTGIQLMNIHKSLKKNLHKGELEMGRLRNLLSET